MKALTGRARKTDAALRSRPAATRDLPTIAFFRAGPLLRRSGPVPGILATARPGAIMDKSGRHFVATKLMGQKPMHNRFSLTPESARHPIGASPRDLLPKVLILLPSAPRQTRTDSVDDKHPKSRGKKRWKST